MARGFVRKRGDMWYAYWRDPAGRQWARAIGTRKKDADAYLVSMQKTVHDGDYKELKEISFAEFAHIWLSDYAALYQKPSTLYSNTKSFESSLIPFFGDVKLTAIETVDVQKYVAHRFSEGKAPATVRKQLILLKTMFKQAISWGYLKTNPAADVKPPKEEYTEMRHLTPDEIKLFLDQVDERYYALFYTAIFTGMRLGELLALQWSDINWNTDTIRIQRSTWNGQFVDPKTRNSIRTVFMTPRLREVLLDHREVGSKGNLNLVFSNEEGGIIGSSNLRQRIFEPALKRAGLPRMRIHDLRHTFASLLIHQGENLKYVQQQLGHTSITTTVDRYGHLMPDVHKGVGNRLDQTVFG